MSHGIWSKPSRGVTGGQRLEQEQSNLLTTLMPGGEKIWR